MQKWGVIVLINPQNGPNKHKNGELYTIAAMSTFVIITFKKSISMSTEGGQYKSPNDFVTNHRMISPQITENSFSVIKFPVS